MVVFCTCECVINLIATAEWVCVWHTHSIVKSRTCIKNTDAGAFQTKKEHDLDEEDNCLHEFNFGWLPIGDKL